MFSFCDPAEIRTRDPPLKRRMLSSLSVPTELRGHFILETRVGFEPTNNAFAEHPFRPLRHLVI